MLRKTITVVVTGWLVAGCGSISASGLPSERATASSPSSTAGESASPTSAPSSASLFGEFDLGDGHKLHLECIGEGSPTIVIDVGNDDTIHGSWGAVFQPMSRISQHAPTTGPTSAGAIPIRAAHCQGPWRRPPHAPPRREDPWSVRFRRGIVRRQYRVGPRR